MGTTYLQLTELKAATQTLSLSQEISLTPEQLWPIISHTDMLNVHLGFAPTENVYTASPQGGSQMQVNTSLAGMPVAYEELPFEWLAPYGFSVDRIFEKGPLSYLQFKVNLTPIKTGTELTASLSYSAPESSPELEGLLKMSLEGILQIYGKFAAALESGKKGVRVFYHEENQALLPQADLAKRWKELSSNPQMASAFAEYIALSPARYAGRVRPFELANTYQFSPFETLQFCFLLAEEKEFHLRWDLRCPSCKGPKENQAHLSQVTENAFCPNCVVDYDIGFDQNLELTFFPDSGIRKVTEDHFCAGGPANTPHLSLQQNIWPEQNKHIKVQLQKGPQIFRALSMAGELGFQTHPEGTSTLNLNLENAFEDTDIAISSMCEMNIYNPKSYMQTLQAEHLDWKADCVTGAMVSALQEFRDLFSNEVLAQDQVLKIGQQVIFMAAILPSDPDTDITDDKELISQTLRDYKGALVRSENTLILGAFTDTLDALNAALYLLKQYEEIHAIFGDKSTGIAMSIYSGPCEAVVFNDNLDYTGFAPDQAADLLSQAQGNDLILSKDNTSPEMLSLLSQENPKVFEFSNSENEDMLYRIQSAEGVENV